MDEWEVLIAGGGPVGLLLGNVLGQRGIRCAVVERRSEPLAESRAIGVMPPSLHILKRLGLDRAFVKAGVQVETARVYSGRGLLGRVDFGGLRGGYPFVLSLPQAETVRLLAANLRQFQCVDYCAGMSVVGFAQSGSKVRVRVRGKQEASWKASVVVGCDGIHSTVRELVQIPSVERPYGFSFLMGDFEDESGLGAEAHLFFSARGSVESFPLPGRKRRWIVSTEQYAPEPEAGLLEDRVRAFSGHDLRGSKQVWQSAFTARQVVCRTYARGRVALCGDAAHVMSPIGGQGMNTGFADAALLGQGLAAVLREGASMRAVFRQYERFRRRAFHVAMRRAEWGMWLGTREGAWASGIRSAFIRYVLLQPPVRDRLAEHVSMWTVPFDGLDLKYR